MKKYKCQCCLTDIIYNKNTDYCFGQKVYSELINETFNISIISEISQICNQCLNKLQEASEFKRMILKAQDELKNIICDMQKNQIINDIKNNENIKIDEKLWEIDKESTISNEDSIESIHQITNLSMVDEQHKIKSLKEKSIKELKTSSNKSVKPKDSIPTLPVEKSIKIQKAIREDSMKLLKYSNMCLFKSLKTKFQCYNCKEAFINMQDLRSHTKIHFNPNNRRLKVNLKGNSSKNVDISSLSCKLCSQACQDLKFLREHLENKHSIKFTTNDHMFIPYKLDNGYQCITCGENFNTFVRLSTHMNTHSTNNVCEICGLFFINRLSLRTHLQSIHKEKKCTICMAIFEKSYAKTKHMRTVHNIGAVKRYCPLCGKVFKHSYMLLEHGIKEHGVKRQISSCVDCNKTFLSPQNLRVHMRSVHFKERNYPCNVCGMRFFTKADEKRHGRRHNDVKLFSCNYCEGRFKSKDSWRRHLKRIHGKLIVD
ncbi:unnamed protein product [Euphydryas editha]|uniref:Uncharacterized protein n=1 Tax=Euphydryas editha TaxID=104508 RepID=A0AAU9UNF7_EUPED|nr:unnamed protein product [Euphydryas editha]